MRQGYGGGREPRDDEPITVDDPTTGFHPDQLTAYPLQRVGTRLYVAHIEAVAGTNLGHDTVLVDANQMDAYPFGSPQEDDFQDVPIVYSALDAPEGREGINEAPYRGEGELVFEDFAAYDGPNSDVMDANGVVSVLLTRPPEDHGLDEVRRKLDRGRIRVEIAPDANSDTAMA